MFPCIWCTIGYGHVVHVESWTTQRTPRLLQAILQVRRHRVLQPISLAVASMVANDLHLCCAWDGRVLLGG